MLKLFAVGGGGTTTPCLMYSVRNRGIAYTLHLPTTCISSSCSGTPAQSQRKHMAATSTVRACNERVTCLRIFADTNGETHMEDIDIDLQPRKLFKDNPPLRLTDNLPASWYNVCYVPTGVGETGWHNPPQRLLVLWLTGEVEFETSDGDIRRLPPGSVVLAEDTTGKGHITRHPPGGQLVVHIALA